MQNHQITSEASRDSPDDLYKAGKWILYEDVCATAIDHNDLCCWEKLFPDIIRNNIKLLIYYVFLSICTLYVNVKTNLHICRKVKARQSIDHNNR